LAAVGDAGLDEQPRRMTDGGNHLLIGPEALDEIDGLRLDTQQVRIDLSAGKNDGIVVVSGDAIEGFIHWDRTAPIILVPARNMAGFERNHMYFGTSFAELVARDFEF